MAFLKFLCWVCVQNEVTEIHKIYARNIYVRKTLN